MEVISQRIIQVIPARNVTARFLLEDGKEEDYPVICWALREVVIKWEGEEEPYTDQETVGMIVLQASPLLLAVDSWRGQGKFIGYRYRVDIVIQE